MAKDAINEYSSTAASNTDVGGVSLAEGVMTVSDINDSMREMMSHLADFSAGTEGIDVLSLQDDDGSASIKIQAPSAVTTTTTLTLPDGDGANGSVLTTNGSGSLSWGSGTPSGSIMPYAGASAPSGWLLSYGQAISRSTYSALFSAVGTTYGVGDGATTFNVPDLRGRTIAGQDDMGGSSANRLTSPINGDTLGGAGGSQSHSLTEAELASHTHFVAEDGTYNGGAWGLSSTLPIREGVPNDTPDNHQYVLKSGDSTADVGLSSPTGSGTAHNNVQPTIILNYIIKT